MRKWLWVPALMLTMLCVRTAAGADVAIDETNFPDDNFRSYVAQFDRNGDGAFSDEELGLVTTIDCGHAADLTGIGYFTALTRLYCTGNRLTEMDISYNPNLFSAVLHGAKTEGEHVEYILDYFYLSADSPVALVTVPSSYIILPSDLTAAEDEAFLNIRADAVIVPPGAVFIGANAFPAGTRIYGIGSSAAMTWADENGCVFFPCTEEWIAALR